MILSLKKNIFLFLFVCFKILLVFSQSTSFELISISFFMVFLLSSFYFFKLKIVVDFKVGLLWVGLLFSLLASSLFTHSIPLSLDAFIFYTASFCTFVFFRSLSSRKIFSQDDFALIFLVIGVILSIFFIIFFSFPSISSFLPSTNIFIAEYGHSHFAALLLLFIPLGWWFVFSSKYSSFRFRQFILILFYILLILTFGRFAIFLALAQLPFLYKFANKRQLKKKYIYFAGLFLFSAFVATVFFSLNDNKYCLTKKFKSQICKPVSKEVRPEYFKQALLSFKSNPFVGYGPGAFPLITRKYNPIAQYSSSYTHNAFLQVFSESGLFAGTFYFLLMIFLFKKMISSNNFIFLGVASLFVNALIDFDWNLFSTHQVTLIFIALVLWDYPKKKIIKKTALLKMFWIFLTTILILLGIINISTKLLIGSSKEAVAFEIFPYFYSQSKIFRTKKNLLDNQAEALYKIYENHDEFVLDNIKSSSSIEEKKGLYKELIEISPWAIVNINHYKILEESGDYETLGAVSQKGLLLFKQLEKQGVHQSYKRKKEVMSYLYESANNHIKNGEPEVAARYYKDILNVQQWIFHTRPPEFLYYEKSTPELIGLFINEVGVKIGGFGQNQDVIYEWYLDDFKKNYFVSNSKDAGHWIEFSHDRGPELWIDISNIANSYYRNNVGANDDLAKASLDLWYQYWLEFVKIDGFGDLDRKYQFKLMNGLFAYEMSGRAEVIRSYLHEGVSP